MKMKIIKETQSYCNICLKKIPSKIFEDNGSIYIKKNAKNMVYLFINICGMILKYFFSS